MNKLGSLVFGGSGGASPFADIGLLLLRVFTGSALTTHGISKVPPQAKLVETVAGLGFPLPELFAWSAGLTELVGGALLVIGLFTRPAAALILFTMLVAAFNLHGGSPFSEQELGLLYGSVAFAFMLIGPGRFSIDALLFRR